MRRAKRSAQTTAPSGDCRVELPGDSDARARHPGRAEQPTANADVSKRELNLLQLATRQVRGRCSPLPLGGGSVVRAARTSSLRDFIPLFQEDALDVLVIRWVGFAGYVDDEA